MKLGIVIYSNDAETVWNAFRFANFSLKEGDTVSIFLLAKGVEYETLDSEKYKIKEQAETFLAGTGRLFACGTCLKSRHAKGSEMCPISTMKDLHDLVKDSDKVVTF
jgi:uncharacterized protein involved in oxidation of intracellular sulfur